MNTDLFDMISTFVGADFLKPPDTLFHYTCPNGLLGIIRNQSLRASNMRYLNDTTEFTYILDLYRDEFHKRKFSKLLGQYEEFADALRSPSAGGYFVCSFSENPDQLSQWRAYCSPHSGYSIGFKSNPLSECALQNNGVLARCIYDKKKQRVLIHKTMEEFISSIQEKYAESNNVNDLKLRILEQDFIIMLSTIFQIIALAPLFKHPAFQEEKEWRLIIPRRIGKPGIKFRVSRELIVPYTEVDLREKEQSIPISEIIVGPTPHPQELRSAIESLCKHEGLEEINVKLSSCPFRSW